MRALIIPLLTLLSLTAHAYDVTFVFADNTELVCTDLSSMRYENSTIELVFPGDCIPDNTTPIPNENHVIDVVGGQDSDPYSLADGSVVTSPVPDPWIQITEQGLYGTATMVDTEHVVYSAAPTATAITDTFKYRLRDSTNDYARPWSREVSVTVNISPGGN